MAPPKPVPNPIVPATMQPPVPNPVIPPPPPPPIEKRKGPLKCHVRGYRVD